MVASRCQSSDVPIRGAAREPAGARLGRHEPRRGPHALPVDRRFIDDLLMMLRPERVDRKAERAGRAASGNAPA